MPAIQHMAANLLDDSQARDAEIEVADRGSLEALRVGGQEQVSRGPAGAGLAVLYVSSHGGGARIELETGDDASLVNAAPTLMDPTPLVYFAACATTARGGQFCEHA